MIPLTEKRFHEIIDLLQDKRGLVNSYFASYISLRTFFDHHGFELVEIIDNDKSYIGFVKKKKNELRFLFEEPSQELIPALVEKYHFDYIGVNMLPYKPMIYSEVTAPSEELVIDISKAISLKDKKLRHDYRRAQNKNPQLRIEEYDFKIHSKKLNQFLIDWSTGRTERQNEMANIENDQQFLEWYADDLQLKGIIITDQEKIVGYNLFIPDEFKSDACISLFSKVLRGYTDLGMLLAIEKYKLMQKCGFITSYLGTINNDFKKHFIKSGEVITTWGGQVHKDEKIIFKSSAEAYVNALLM